jgi:hypothetical protein
VLSAHCSLAIVQAEKQLGELQMNYELRSKVGRDVAVAAMVNEVRSSGNLRSGRSLRLMLACLLSWLPVGAAVAKNTVYDNPRYYSNRLPIDYCLYPAKQCGHAAADRYCKDMNAGSVIDFKWGRSDSGTYIQGTGDICDLKKFNQCIALTQIVCGYFTL